MMITNTGNVALMPISGCRCIFTLYVMSDSYLGLDQQYDIHLNVMPASTSAAAQANAQASDWAWTSTTRGRWEASPPHRTVRLLSLVLVFFEVHSCFQIQKIKKVLQSFVITGWNQRQVMRSSSTSFDKASASTVQGLTRTHLLSDNQLMDPVEAQGRNREQPGDL